MLLRGEGGAQYEVENKELWGGKGRDMLLMTYQDGSKGWCGRAKGSKELYGSVGEALACDEGREVV